MNLIPSFPIRPTGMALALWLALASQTGAQTTNWFAFNDHNLNRAPAPTTGPNVTLYHLGLGPGGPLTNQATGEQLAATLIVTWTGGDGPDNFGASNDPNVGTPAYNLFNAIVDVGGTGAGVDEGIPGLRNSEDNVITLTFTNLDPGRKYSFRGTAVRGNNYNDRWAYYAIQGAASFLDAHVDGSANLNIFTAATFPGGSLTSGQVALNSGENRVGSLVGWDDIIPAPDGTFSILERQYTGPAPFGTPSAGPYAYGLNAIMLAEIETGPPFAPTNQNVNLPANATVPSCANLVLTSSFSASPPPAYLWFKNGVAMNTAANPSAATRSLALNNIQPGDAGSYRVRVSNGSGTAVSRDAIVTVTTDSPHILGAVALASNNVSFLVTFDRAMNFISFDPFTFHFVARTDTNLFNDLLSTSGSLTNGTNLLLTTLFPRVVGVNYRLAVDADGIVDSCAGNPVGATNLNAYTEVVLADFDIDTDLWSYNESGNDLGAAWREPAYDASAWLTGPAFFGLETAANVLGVIRTPWSVSTNITYYLRKSVNVPAPGSQISSLTLRQQVDDGSVTYINGVEVDRYGFAAGVTVTNGSLAASPAEPQPLITTSLSTSNVIEGRNVIAVEVHQTSTNSSDILYGSKLSAICRTVYPGLNIARSGSTVTVSWSEYGIDGRLQTSTNLVAWMLDTRTPAHVGDTYSLTYTVPAGSGRLFIRLRP